MFNNGLAAIVKDGTYDKIINTSITTNQKKEAQKKATDETTIVGLIKKQLQTTLQGLGITLD